MKKLYGGPGGHGNGNGGSGGQSGGKGGSSGGGTGTPGQVVPHPEHQINQLIDFFPWTSLVPGEFL